MSTQGLEQILVSIIIAFLSSFIALLKIQMSKFIKKYEPTLQLFEKQMEESIGKEQYDKDVATIKNVLSEVNTNKESITLEIADLIVKQVASKVTLNEHEILDIIMQIAKGVL